MAARHYGDRIPNMALRERFIASGLTLAEVAIGAGWDREKEGRLEPDTSKVSVMLGLRPTTARGYCSTRARITEKVALELGRALGLDPREIVDANGLAL